MGNFVSIAIDIIIATDFKNLYQYPTYIYMERGSGNLAASGIEIRHVWNAIESTCACATS